MKYLKFFEKSDSIKTKYSKFLDLPYNDFISVLKKNAKDPDFQNILKSGLSDESSEDEVVNYSKIKIRANKLIPTRSEISLNSVISFINEDLIREVVVKGEAETLDKKRIFIVNNKWIIDGHHRWASVYILNPEANIPAININLKSDNLQEILKTIQLSIAATYGDIYLKDIVIKNDIGKVTTNVLGKPEIDSIPVSEIITKTISKEKLDYLQEIFAQTDFKRVILRFLLSDVLNESTESDKRSEFDQLEETDNNNSKVGDILSTAGDLAGIIDPTGAIDILNGIFYLYQGEYMLALSSFISAVPLGDLIGKPLIMILKGKAIRKTAKLLAKAIREMDIKKAAAIFEKLGKKYPIFNKFLEKIVEYGPKLLNILEKVLDKFGNNYGKLKIFYMILKNKLLNFFKSVLDWKKNLANWLKEVGEEDVLDILSVRVLDIKNLIESKLKPKIKIKTKFLPHPNDMASLKKRGFETSKNYIGIDIDLLKKLKSGQINFKKASEKKLKSFESFSRSI